MANLIRGKGSGSATRRAARSNGRGNGNGTGPFAEAASRRKALFASVDYTFAKRALIREFRTGLTSQFDICDAHPELMRAAKHMGEPASRDCPVCRRSDLRLLAYVYADDLAANNGRVWDLHEGLALAASHRGGCCYVVEVCTWCSWNHLRQAFRARRTG